MTAQQDKSLCEACDRAARLKPLWGKKEEKSLINSKKMLSFVIVEHNQKKSNA